MSVKDYVEALRSKHAHLERRIDNELHRSLPDQLVISRLKREKLRIKDEMARLDRSLEEQSATASELHARSPAQLAFEKLGGAKLVGIDVRSEADFLEVLDHGIPLGALSELTKESLTAEEVERLIIPRRTLSHRKARNQPLSRAESERALRVASILSQAEQTFANREKAHTWLRRSTSALGGRRPIDLLDSEPGARLVEQLLYRIGHGIAA